MKNHHIHTQSNAIDIAFILNLGFAISEFVAGFLFQSTALLSDAVHDSGDVLSLFLSAIISRYSKKKPTAAYSYGFGRLNLLIAIINSVVLLVGSAFVIREAVLKMFAPQAVNSLGMFLMSILGILINLYAVIRLKGTKNILNKSVMLHLTEDLLGWVAVFVCSIVIYFTGWNLLDPLISLAISIFVVINALGNLKQCYQMMMMRTSDEQEATTLTQALASLPGVIRVIDCHYWSLDGEHQILTAKVLVAKGENPQLLRQAINQELSPYHIACSTIEFIWEEGQEGSSEDL